jgi:hypothetical protein
LIKIDKIKYKEGSTADGETVSAEEINIKIEVFIIKSKQNIIKRSIKSKNNIMKEGMNESIINPPIDLQYIVCC